MIIFSIVYYSLIIILKQKNNKTCFGHILHYLISHTYVYYCQSHKDLMFYEFIYISKIIQIRPFQFITFCPTTEISMLQKIFDK